MWRNLKISPRLAREARFWCYLRIHGLEYTRARYPQLMEMKRHKVYPSAFLVSNELRGIDRTMLSLDFGFQLYRIKVEGLDFETALSIALSD